jgi:hypothetical protein
MKKNFAAPPEGFYIFPERGGTTFNVTDVNSSAMPGQIFSSSYQNMFKTPSMVNFKNADGIDPYDYTDVYNQILYGDSGTTSTSSAPTSSGGGFFSGLNLGSILQSAATIYANEQQIKLAEQQGKITAEQAAKARAELAAAQAQAQVAASQGQTTIDKIKAYAVPIAITGVVVVAGIAAYFFFKKKKIQ